MYTASWTYLYFINFYLSYTLVKWIKRLDRQTFWNVLDAQWLHRLPLPQKKGLKKMCVRMKVEISDIRQTLGGGQHGRQIAIESVDSMTVMTASMWHSVMPVYTQVLYHSYAWWHQPFLALFLLVNLFFPPFLVSVKPPLPPPPLHKKRIRKKRKWEWSRCYRQNLLNVSFNSWFHKYLRNGNLISKCFWWMMYLDV